jgi:RNA polymerase-binding transcription factor DksA
LARTSKASKASKATKKSAGAKKSTAKRASSGSGSSGSATKAAGGKSRKSPARKSSTKTPAKKAASKSPTNKGTAKRSSSGKSASGKPASGKPASGRSASGTTTTKKAPAKASKTSKGEARSAGSANSRRSGRKVRSPFDSRFLERMRKSLITERDVYERQAKQLRAEAESLVADLDPGDVQFDEESGEGDTIAVERGRDLALASKAQEMIDEIDHALGKFDDGSYGICEVSGEPIPKERLEAIPWAREKVEYKVGGFGRR